jgi:hypothetical protein
MNSFFGVLASEHLTAATTTEKQGSPPASAPVAPSHSLIPAFDQPHWKRREATVLGPDPTVLAVWG